MSYSGVIEIISEAGVSLSFLRVFLMPTSEGFRCHKFEGVFL